MVHPKGNNTGSTIPLRVARGSWPIVSLHTPDLPGQRSNAVLGQTQAHHAINTVEGPGRSLANLVVRLHALNPKAPLCAANLMI